MNNANEIWDSFNDFVDAEIELTVMSFKLNDGNENKGRFKGKFREIAPRIPQILIILHKQWNSRTVENPVEFSNGESPWSVLGMLYPNISIMFNFKTKRMFIIISQGKSTMIENSLHYVVFPIQNCKKNGKNQDHEVDFY